MIKSFNESFAYDWNSTVKNLIKDFRVLKQLVG